jgi:hypothetical protein
MERLKVLEETVFAGKENMGQGGPPTTALKEMDKKLILTLQKME